MPRGLVAQSERSALEVRRAGLPSPWSFRYTPYSAATGVDGAGNGGSRQRLCQDCRAAIFRARALEGFQGSPDAMGRRRL